MAHPFSAPLKLALAVTVLAVAGCAQAMRHHHEQVLPEGSREVARATADIAGNGITGKATLIEYQLNKGPLVHVIVDVKGDPAVLKPGLHGIHLHAIGDCSSPDFKSAGGHFDPGPASNVDPDVNHPFHMGDMPNLLVNERGEGHLDAFTSRVTVSAGPLTLFDGDGSAIIIHRDTDQWISGAKGSGVSGGPRLACGVIMK